MIFHGWLGQIEGFFRKDAIRLIDLDSCVGIDICRLYFSSDHDVSYPRLERFSRVVFDLEG